MLVRILNGLLATATLALLGACSTPCDAPGGLCAPIEPNTSSAPARPRAADLAAPVPQTAPVPAAIVQTLPVDAPDAAPAAAPIRIGLLLPLHSEALGPPADALRAGFMAAHERERAGFTVNLIETGDSADEALDAYAAALTQNDIIVGPLARSAVGAIAASGAVTKPTIALNHPDGRADVALPPNMLVIGLSIEDEARQVAQWAAAEFPGSKALIVSGTNNWQRRIASAFAAQWKQLGNRSDLVELAASGGYLNEGGIIALKTRIETELPTLMFGALDADQLRQVRSIVGPALTTYGTSSVNPGTVQGASALVDLDGTRLLDMPWEVHPDHSAVMVYPRWLGAARSLDLDRLYALGIDAFRVARQVALKPNAPFKMDGVTGRLSVDFGAGRARFARSQSSAVYQGGAFKLVEQRR
jgi:outer membrane PBP1 activator LpoA protein